jgi:hypothetical protein
MSRTTNCRTHSPNSSCFKRAAVEVSAFDQEKWVSAGVANLADLTPEPTLNHRTVEIVNRLSFDDRLGTDRIVTRWQRQNLDFRSERLESFWNPAPSLENVRRDRETAHVGHGTVKLGAGL